MKKIHSYLRSFENKLLLHHMEAIKSSERQNDYHNLRLFENKLSLHWVKAIQLFEITSR